MSTNEIAPRATVEVDVRFVQDGEPVESVRVVGEDTDAAGLVITPRIDADGVIREPEWHCITHIPTGWSVPVPDPDDADFEIADRDLLHRVITEAAKDGLDDWTAWGFGNPVPAEARDQWFAAHARVLSDPGAIVVETGEEDDDDSEEAFAADEDDAEAWHRLQIETMAIGARHEGWDACMHPDGTPRPGFPQTVLLRYLDRGGLTTRTAFDLTEELLNAAFPERASILAVAPGLTA